MRVSEAVNPVCEHCGSHDLTRLLSRFAMVRSEESRLDDLTSDSALADVDESDPKSMGRWMKRMGRELGEDVGGDLDEMMDDMGGAGDADGGDEL